MAKSYNQKVKILYLQKMLHETGEDRVVTMQEILTRLLEYGIHAERKSIYDDIESLRSFGMDVKFKRGRPGGYYVAGQMAQDKREHEETPVIQEVLSHKENSAAGEKVRTLEPAETEKKAVPEPKAEKKTVPGQNFKFTKEADSGSGKQMKLLCRDKTKKAVQSYFGKAAQYKDKELGYFTVTATVTKNPLFYGWLTSMGRDVHILKPKKAALNYREYLKSLAKEYKGI
ncbi:MAG: WYL domain-containing protein [Eubacteriales bacterium]|nr:WYL domain-containing protein [Eubacteriales bacterium]